MSQASVKPPWDGYWDKGKSSLKEPQKSFTRRKQGNGGLSTLLTPVVSKNLKYYEDESGPQTPYTDDQVLIFKRTKKAQLTAALEKIAAAEARVKQRRTQLNTAPNPETATAGMRQAHASQKTMLGDPKTTNYENGKHKLPVKKAPWDPASPYHSKSFETKVRRIKEVNHEEARAHERHQRARAEAKVEDSGRAGTLCTKICAKHQGEESYCKQKTKDGEGKLTTKASQQFNRRPSRSRESLLRVQPEVMQLKALEHIANWERELRSAEGFKEHDRMASIQEDPGWASEKEESLPVASGPLRIDQSIDRLPITDPIEVNKLGKAQPDHYSVEDDCFCKSSFRRKQTNEREPHAKLHERFRTAREHNQNEARNWLRGFCSSIAFS